MINLIGGFHAMGTLLAVGMLMLPAIAARFWCSGVATMIGVSLLIGMASSVIGLVLSYHAGLATGPTIILAAGAIYIVSLLIGPHGGLIRQFAPQRHLEA